MNKMSIKHLKRFFIVCLLFALTNAMAGEVENRGGKNPGKEAGLTKAQAARLGAQLMTACSKKLAAQLKTQWNNHEISGAGHSLRFKYKIFGKKPADGRSLFISMHGGGNAEPQVNDQQWENQIRLYTPSEGVYVAPRAPTNTWNLWHESHIDTLFDRLIEAAVIFEGVNPDKVYLMGYSAGGDGVYQLAPRMADRWAAASMMAGHPNDASPLNLRNIGFCIHVGALDSAYSRNEVARHWGQLLDSLSSADPGGYKHLVKLHEGRAHWMLREDTVAVPWMMTFKRNPLPGKVVWRQDDVHHSSFYWLAVPKGSEKTGGEIVASYQGNQIIIEKNYSESLIIRLNDKMLDLDKPVTVKYLGEKIFKGKIHRKASVIKKTVQERKDPGLIFDAEIVIVNGKVVKV